MARPSLTCDQRDLLEMLVDHCSRSQDDRSIPLRYSFVRTGDDTARVFCRAGVGETTLITELQYDPIANLIRLDELRLIMGERSVQRLTSGGAFYGLQLQQPAFDLVDWIRLAPWQRTTRALWEDWGREGLVGALIGAAVVLATEHGMPALLAWLAALLSSVSRFFQ